MVRENKKLNLASSFLHGSLVQIQEKKIKEKKIKIYILKIYSESFSFSQLWVLKTGATLLKLIRAIYNCPKLGLIPSSRWIS